MKLTILSYSFLSRETINTRIKDFADSISPLASIIKEKLANGMEITGDRTDQPLNERPVIGILTQPRNATHNYIMAAYIKFVEQAGARVVPIHHTDSDEQILTLLSQINGVVFPGGGTDLNNEDGSLTEYSRKGKVILDRVKEMNDQGIYFPVWAICLGFQQVTVIEAPFQNVLLHNSFDSYNYANNVTFIEDLSKSKMYRDMPQHLVNAIQKENITFNSHHDGVYPETYSKFPGLQDYYVLAVSYDNKGVRYTATIEHKVSHSFWVKTQR